MHWERTNLAVTKSNRLARCPGTCFGQRGGTTQGRCVGRRWHFHKPVTTLMCIDPFTLPIPFSILRECSFKKTVSLRTENFSHGETMLYFRTTLLAILCICASSVVFATEPQSFTEICEQTPSACPGRTPPTSAPNSEGNSKAHQQETPTTLAPLTNMERQQKGAQK